MRGFVAPINPDSASFVRATLAIASYDEWGLRVKNSA